MSSSHAGIVWLGMKPTQQRRYSAAGTAGGMPPDCSMTPTLGRSALASLAGSSPSTRTVPPSAFRYPSQISMVVVLPAPFGPRMAVTSPRQR